VSEALALSLVGLCLVSSTTAAQVQGCGDDAGEVDGDFEVTPEDRAESVARNAPIIVRYASDVDLEELQASVASERDAEQPVPCAGELACVLETERGEDPRVIDAEVEVEGQSIVLTPREPLAAEAEHTVLVVQPGLDIVARSESSFVTGERRDREPPELGYDAEDVSVSVVDLPPECGEPEDSRRVVLELPPATDDGDAESVTIEIVLLGERDSEVRARAANDGDPVLVSFILSPAEAAERVCLEVHAYDALGQKAEREPRLCFNPGTRPLFSSACAAALAGRDTRRDKGWGAFAWSWLGGLLGGLWARAAWRRVPGKRL
jgi:hypothetical protein